MNIKLKLLILIMGLGNSLSITAQVPSEKNEKPNIIFILADDMGYNDMGAYGQKSIVTPNLDQMAQEGIRFTQHYAGSSVCAPSRGVLMTGLHTGHSAIRGNFGMEIEGNLPIPDSAVTVAELLQEAGYKTGIIGKWGLGGAGSVGGPNNQGFDYSFCYLDQRNAHNYYPPYLWRNEEKYMLKGNEDGAQVQYSHDLFTKEALKFIKEKNEKPFFLYLPYTIPHGDYVVPDDSPYSEEEWPQNLKNYAAMISRMDKDVGKILNLLKDLEIDEKTIVFFTSDNGPSGGVNKKFDSNGPLRGTKFELYEGGIRIPLVVRWPGNIKPATVSEHISAFWDFLPTASEISGVTPPAGIDGISYLPTLLGTDQKNHEFLYWELFNFNYNWSPDSGKP